MNPPENTRTAIELLELPSKFSRTDLNAARRDQLQVWHPDRFSSNERLRRKAEERTKRINEACDFLQKSMRGDTFEWVPQHQNGDRTQAGTLDLLRQNRELQESMRELRKQHEDAISSIKSQHANAVNEVKQRFKNSEDAMRSDHEHEQAELIERCALLKTALNQLEGEKRRNSTIHAYFSKYFLAPMRELILSIAALTQKAWLSSDNYLKQNVPNNAERVTLATMILFLVALSIFVFCIAMPKSLLITITCVIIIGGSGHVILTTHRTAANKADAKKRK